MNNKTVLITGCSSGFGRELVRAFLAREWLVIATMRRANDREEMFQSEMAQNPGRLVCWSLDITDESDRQAVATMIQQRFAGKLDCLINNAGYGLFGALEDLTEAQIRRQMEVNFFGLALMTQQMLPAVRAAKGRIINISSVVGYFGVPMSTLYCTSKFAVEGLTEALYYELQPFGVQVALVEPGSFRTDFSSNVQWGKHCFSSDSPYYVLTRGYEAFRKRQRSGPGNPISPVIEAVVRLAEVRRMPLRVKCGRDARWMFTLKRWLPERVHLGLFSRIFRKLFAS